ncbi:hypothetical protein ASZ90_008711 [hydrocarbon metagenome]|uniref:Uncharacterized protein n=1 Tax=hydrocarbon metagenome TaxID=938273 RepID=A0A0W8FKT1_9ZZZZ
MAYQAANAIKSRPARARGLKLLKKGDVWTGQVAPREGAWIETSVATSDSLIPGVAPREGAWIETINTSALILRTFVAPREGAWIETR